MKSYYANSEPANIKSSFGAKFYSGKVDDGLNKYVAYSKNCVRFVLNAIDEAGLTIASESGIKSSIILPDTLKMHLELSAAQTSTLSNIYNNYSIPSGSVKGVNKYKPQGKNCFYNNNDFYLLY